MSWIWENEWLRLSAAIERLPPEQREQVNAQRAAAAMKPAGKGFISFTRPCAVCKHEMRSTVKFHASYDNYVHARCAICRITGRLTEAEAKAKWLRDDLTRMVQARALADARNAKPKRKAKP
jgi:hypothetical protein